MPLIKYHDRLTSDGFIGLRSLFQQQSDVALDAFLTKVRENPNRQNQLPFAKSMEACVRYILYKDKTTSVLSHEYASSQFKIRMENCRLTSSLVNLRANPIELESYMVSNFHSNAAFDQSAVFVGIFHGTPGYEFYIQEGQNGRKYKRTKEEILEFIANHPSKENFLETLSMMMNFQYVFKSTEDLGSFLSDNEGSMLDWTIDRIDQDPGFRLFPLSYEDEAMKTKKAYYTELNPHATATIDYLITTEPSPDQAVPSFGNAAHNLREALHDIIHFSENNKLTGYAEYYGRALEKLNHPGEISLNPI